MQDTSCVPHAWSYSSVPCQGSHSVQQGRTEAALGFVRVSLQTVATEGHRLRPVLTPLQSQEAGDRGWGLSPLHRLLEHVFAHNQGDRELLQHPAECICSPGHSQGAKGRELLLSFTAGKLEGQKTQFVTHSWLPAGHSLLLHLLQHSAQAGSFSADCALERGDPSEGRTAPKTARALVHPPSVPYPILTKKLEEMRLVLSLTKY